MGAVGSVWCGLFRPMVGAAWLVACGPSRPTPLYAASEKPASPSEVATLYGDVREVDGKVVSEHGGSFELLPGCHTVKVRDGNVESTFQPAGEQELKSCLAGDGGGEQS